MARRVRNVRELSALAESSPERIALGAWLLRLAVRRIARSRRTAVTTIELGGVRYTLDWNAAEHVPLREVVVRRSYWPTPWWRPRPGELVVDVGANAGVFTIAAALAVGAGGRVVAIEPNATVAARLMENVAENRLTDRVTVYPVAAGERSATGRLVVERNTTVGIVEPGPGTTPIETVDALVGDRVVGLLKVDVEAHEAAVLRGARTVLERVRGAVIEHDEVALPAIRAELERAGLTDIEVRSAGPESGAHLVFARRPLP